MSTPDDELLQDYVGECREHLVDIETHLLAMEEAGAAVDEELVNRVFRAAHSIKGGAGLFELTTINELAHKTENVLGLVRSRAVVPTPELVNLLLLAFDKLRELINDVHQSNQIDVSEVVLALAELTAANLHGASPAPAGAGAQPTGASVAPPPSPPADTSPPPASSAADPEASEAAAPAPVSSDAKRADSLPPPNMPAVRDAPSADTTLRVNVALLEQLIDLAGELVLSRNQLNEAAERGDLDTIRLGAQRISAVTSDLQQTIMQTRLQPIGVVLGRLPRLVRDLSRELGKETRLELAGEDVEMDKTIIEGLAAPLTHMVRNAVDHGIELPEVRFRGGKQSAGTIRIAAYHEAGQVVVEVSDDGRGLDARAIGAVAVQRGAVAAEQVRAMSEKELLELVFIPGVSTVHQVTDVSGRGVGMDVVKSNLERLGGKVEIESTWGKGTLFRIKLPLTLAIIPSLLVTVGGEHFALPQVNVRELVCVPASEVKTRVEVVGDAEVLTVRGELIPVLHLADLLGIERSFEDPLDGVRRRSRRERLADRRSPRRPTIDEQRMADVEPMGDRPLTGEDRRGGQDRRFDARSDMQVAIVSASALRYGLVVDELHDTVEIVVKPLGRHLRRLREYAGATILGTGEVALILDVHGLAAKARMSTLARTIRARALAIESQRALQQEMVSLLLFCNRPDESCAVPLDQVSRIEQIDSSVVERVGGRLVMQYRGATLPLLTLGDATSLSPLPDRDEHLVIVFDAAGRSFGLLASPPVDVVDVAANIDRETLRQRGILGSTIVGAVTTLIVDLFELVEAAYPQWVGDRQAAVDPRAASRTILLVEDSDFFRNEVRKYMEGDGYRVLVAEDGEAAWETLSEHADGVDLVVSDIEMPRLGGLGLARRIRADNRFSRMPIIALSSLASEDDITRGLAAGVTEYLVKLDKEKLLEAVRHHLREIRVARA